MTVLCFACVLAFFLHSGHSGKSKTDSSPAWEDIGEGGGLLSGRDGMQESPADGGSASLLNDGKVEAGGDPGDGSGGGSSGAPGDGDKQELSDKTEDEGTPEDSGNSEAVPIAVEDLAAARVSSGEITLSWPDDHDERAGEYIVMRKPAAAADSEWREVGRLSSDGKAGNGRDSFSDKLTSPAPQQYLYRVDMEMSGENGYTASEGDEVLRSNVLICLDPGHYSGKNAVNTPDSYGYEENIATLGTGIRLRDLLEEKYGIASVMTRDSEHISIGGFSDKNLDSSHISLRGKSAAGSDYFISLHTNSNRDNINGYPTFNQPIAINKPIVLVSLYSLGNETAISIANAIGTNLSRLYEKEGLSTVSGFDTAAPNAAKEWSMDYNDGLNMRGAVCVRHGENGEYYGVLRGATEAGVPGLIVEHGHHTTTEIRRAAMEGDLLSEWASADAAGIAAGLGFVAAE